MEKGKKGYIAHKRRLNAYFVASFAVVIIGLYIAGLIIFKSRNNYLTLIAVVLVLPAAKFIVNLIISLKSSEINNDFYKKLEGLNYNYLAYDLIVSNKKSPESFKAAAFNNNTIYLYSNKKQDEKFIIESIKDFLANVKIKANVHIYNKEDEYFKAVERISQQNSNLKKEDTLKIDYLEKQFLNMCV